MRPPVASARWSRLGQADAPSQTPAMNGEAPVLADLARHQSSLARAQSTLVRTDVAPPSQRMSRSGDGQSVARGPLEDSAASAACAAARRATGTRKGEQET